MDNSDLDRAEEARRRALEAERRAEEAREEAERQARIAREETDREIEMARQVEAENIQYAEGDHLYGDDNRDYEQDATVHHYHEDPDDDEHLPWLESPEDYKEESNDTMRIVAFALLALLLVGLIAASIWWYNRDGADMDGDGSLIAAPEDDYKSAPDDPQTQEVEGTGDVSFAASEGEEPEVRMGDGDNQEDAVNSNSTNSSADGNVDNSPVQGALVQVGAFGNQAAANQRWNELTGQYSFIDKGKKRIMSANVDGGTIYRLNVVADNQTTANDVCAKLKNAGENCIVKP